MLNHRFLLSRLYARPHGSSNVSGKSPITTGACRLCCHLPYLGLHVSRDPLCRRDYSSADQRRPASTRSWLDSACLVLDKRNSSREAASSSRNYLGWTFLSRRSRHPVL